MSFVCSGDKLWKKIPFDVFINHIMPFVYKKQNVTLLDDIRNFWFDYRMIGDYYFYGLNEFCLLVDLTFFCNNGISLYRNIDGRFIDILDRNMLFSRFSLDKKRDFVNRYFYLNSGTKTHVKNKILLLLMTPIERTRFINDYLIVDIDVE